MKRWTFREDYIVCKYTYEHIFKSNVTAPLSYLLLELQNYGFDSRSEGSIRKRIRDYLALFSNEQSPYITKQEIEICQYFMDRINNPDRYESIKAYISKSFDSNYTPTASIGADVSPSTFEIEQNNLLHYTYNIEYSSTFPMVLQKYVNLKGINKHTAMCKRIGVKPGTFSAILRGKYKEVQKDNILRICVGLKLSVDEAEELLNSAGFMLSDAKMTDVVVKAFLWNRKYSVVAINMELQENGEPELFSGYEIEIES